MFKIFSIFSTLLPEYLLGYKILKEQKNIILSKQGVDTKTLKEQENKKQELQIILDEIEQNNEDVILYKNFKKERRFFTKKGRYLNF